MNIVAPRVHQEYAGPGHQIAFRGIALGGVVLVQGGPRTQIVPAKIGRQAENISRLLAFRRTRLKATA